MTPAEFKKKWSRFTGKESAAYQSHFDDLCRMLGVPTPLEADPSGRDFFCYQKGVIQEAELLPLDDDDNHAVSGRRRKTGFADVWKKGCFGWEYKGQHKNLDEAHRQLQRYRESLENPPLLVVCDFRRYVVKTNFNGTVQDVFEFTHETLDGPDHRRVLRALFTDPDALRPQRTTAQVTETLAAQIAEVAKSLQKREAAELADARTRAELSFAARKNLRIARFLNRIVFCFFAEDTGLLPRRLFSELLKTGLADPRHFAATLETLFGVMATGGAFGKDKIRHFNGHLFEESTVFELNAAELRTLAEAGEADWQFIQPSIMGTLFERALEPEQRSQLGAHYTSEADIKTLVEPVLMAPLRREWAVLKGELAPCHSGKKADKPGLVAAGQRLAAFQKKLAGTVVLDPACGSGNFLYVALQLLLDLEKEVVTGATQLGFDLEPRVGVSQLRAIEINPYAYELAQVSVQIGHLQWRRDNGFDNDRSPVLQDLAGFQNEDALLVPHFRSKAKSLREAQAGEHSGDDALKFFIERGWPQCDVIVGNPPFLGTKKLRAELSDAYVEELFRVYGHRIPNFSDLCCYWFEKARELIEQRRCRRAGLLATQGIRGGLNREVLKNVLESGGIFFAEADRPWVLDGANVHVSMVGFDDGKEKVRILNGEQVARINANLTALSDTTQAQRLRENRAIGFIADVKAGQFDLPEAEAARMLHAPNPNGRPNSDVLLPWVNSLDVLRRPRDFWIVDFGADASLEVATRYEMPFAKIKADVFPARSLVKRKGYRDYWWIHAEPCSEMRERIAPLARFLVTATVSKHRIFAWEQPPTLPDHQLVAFARSDDSFFGVLHSRFHEVWALAQGTQLREKESGFRYTPTTCFETFPFPFPDDLALPPSKFAPEPPRPSWHGDLTPERAYAAAAHFYSAKEEPAPCRAGPMRPAEHRAAIAAAAQELNRLRERWLNPPEWTRTEILVFPASVDGPWARYVEGGDLSPPAPADESSPAAAGQIPPQESTDRSAHSKTGPARYPRLVPKDADCAAKLKKRTLTNLYNQRPAWLDLAHRKLDAAVAAAYGWIRAGQAETDLGDGQILERLLALNLERAAAETQAARPARKAQRGQAAGELL